MVETAGEVNARSSQIRKLGGADCYRATVNSQGCRGILASILEVKEYTFANAAMSGRLYCSKCCQAFELELRVRDKLTSMRARGRVHPE